MMYREITINSNSVKLTPYGFCACGCGEKVNVKFKKGHHFRNAGHRKWNGGKKSSSKYLLVSVPGHPRADVDGYVREHILIAEKALGKFIKQPHVVHQECARRRRFYERHGCMPGGGPRWEDDPRNPRRGFLTGTVVFTPGPGPQDG